MGPKLSLFVGVPGSQPPPLGPLREVMIMLLLRRCFVAAHEGSEANPKDLEAVEDVKPQVLQASWSSNAVLGWVGGWEAWKVIVRSMAKNYNLNF